MGAATAACTEARSNALERVLIAAAPWDSPDFCSRGSDLLLLVNLESAAAASAAAVKTLRVDRWSRASTGGAGGLRGRPWPSRGLNGVVGEAIARVSHFRAATEMMVEAVVPQLEEGGGLWLLGSAAEGIHVVKELLLRHFGEVTLAFSSRSDGDLALIHAAGCRPPEQNSSLERWRTATTIKVDGNFMPWATFPGLFANGEVDIMTTVLLAALPPLPNHARVLDHCCGSGVIAAALLRRNGTVKMELLDNDAVAIKAAKRNVESAAAFHLASGLGELHDSVTSGDDKAASGFDWIVSNPPVHIGLDSEFGVLDELVRLGPECLAPKGKLFFVTQTYIPIESLSTKSAKLESMWTDGRFTVWCHTRGE